MTTEQGQGQTRWDQLPHGCYWINDVKNSRVTAYCSCGWSSGPVVDAETAGKAWDDHREQELARP